MATNGLFMFCKHEQFKRYGLTRHGEQRFRCALCGKTWSARNEARENINVVSAVKRELFLSSFNCGKTSLRQSAKAAGIHRNTGMGILRQIGFQRRCLTCGGPVHRNRRYCCDACQPWVVRIINRPRIERVPLFDATAILLRQLETYSQDDLFRLALEKAQMFSELHAADYIGECYLVLTKALGMGMRNDTRLDAYLRKAVLSNTRPERASFMPSLDARKEAYGWEPALNGR